MRRAFPNSTRTVIGIASSACLLLGGCGSSDAETAPSTSSTEAEEATYAPTAEERKFVDTFHDVLEVNGGGEDGAAGKILSDVRYISDAKALDIVTTWESAADVDENVAETLCAVADLAEVQTQDVLATSSVNARVVSPTGTPVHTCS